MNVTRCLTPTKLSFLLSKNTLEIFLKDIAETVDLICLLAVREKKKTVNAVGKGQTLGQLAVQCVFFQPKCQCYLSYRQKLSYRITTRSFEGFSSYYHVR